jgi:hypothetical protein
MEGQKAANAKIFNGLDTTGYSPLHKLFYKTRENKDPSILSVVATVYLRVLAVTMVPLYLTAWFDLPISMKPQGPLKLPFFYDWNVHFMILFSLPMIMAFIVTDQLLLKRAIAKIVSEGILSISSAVDDKRVSSWNESFRKINLRIQFFGVIAGAVIAYVNFVLYYTRTGGFWFLKDGHFPVTGGVYLYCIFLFYWAVSVYVLRTFLIS